MTGSIAPNRPGHHGTVVARTVGTVAISCNVRRRTLEYLGISRISQNLFSIFKSLMSIRER